MCICLPAANIHHLDTGFVLSGSGPLIFISPFIPVSRHFSRPATLSRLFSSSGWMQDSVRGMALISSRACIVGKEQPRFKTDPFAGNVYYYSARSVLTVIGNYPSMLCTNNPFFNDDDLFSRDIGYLRSRWYIQLVSACLANTLDKLYLFSYDARQDGFDFN